MTMRVVIGSDHAGYPLKEEIKGVLSQLGTDFEDFGTHSSDPADYPVIALRTAGAVSKGEKEIGILICGSGIGMSIVANKIRGIRAANCTSVQMAEMARKHNNANVLTLGARIIESQVAKEIVKVFLNTEADPSDRHQRRIAQIHELTHR